MAIFLSSLMDSLRLDPVLFLYMFTSFLKYPVFQSLIYEKVCYQDDNPLNGTFVDCKNLTQIHHNNNYQEKSNHVYLVSSLCLTLPSLISALILGKVYDTGSHTKLSLIIPFFGLILNDANYIIQAFYIKSNPYYLVISDVLFGICGGYTAIMGLINSYNVRSTLNSDRSKRISRFEGSIAMGATLGSALSGIMRESLGYTYLFGLILSLHCLCLVYVVLIVQNDVIDEDDRTRKESLQCLIVDVFKPILVQGISKIILASIFVCLSIELFAYSGVSDIQYSYFLYKFAWGDKSFGLFSGLSSGISGIGVLFLYPILINRFAISNHVLAIVGFCTKIITFFLMVFINDGSWIFLCLVPALFSRFIATGLRSLASQNTSTDQQGKLFTFVEMVQGITSLISSLVYNSLYPQTLSFFSGTMFLVSAVICVIPLLILIKLHFIIKKLDCKDDII